MPDTTLSDHDETALAVAERTPRTPFPFQETAIQRGVDANTYLALPCGLGKSLCAVEIAKRLRMRAESQGLWGFKVLICLSPKVAAQQWRNEILAQDCDPRVQVYVGDQCVVPLIDPLAHTDPCYVVLYYEQLSMFEHLLTRTTWDVVVFDESHYLNNRNAARTQIAAKLRARRTIAMSATPYDRSIIETWSVLHLLYPKEFVSYWAFRNKYALLSAPREGGYREVLGTNPQALATFAPRLKAIMYRISKEKALPQLPPLTVTRVPIVLSAEQRALYDHIKHAPDIELDMSEYWDVPQDTRDDDDQYMLIKSVLARIVRLQQAAVYPALLGAWNVPSAKLEWLDDYFNNNRDERIVVFTRFRAVAEALARKYGSALIVGGAREGVDEFRACDPHVRVLVGTIAAMGTALSLGMARTAIFVDSDWSSIKMYQATQRIHRADITEPKHLIYLDALKTEDMRVKRILERKASESALVASFLTEDVE
jgi:SNF2 family DNA or RNA helicase